MSLESIITPLLNPLVNDNVYLDVAPEGAQTPCIIWQRVGGQAIEYVSQELPDSRNARIQVMAWSKTRMQAVALCEQIRAVMVSAPGVAVKTLGAPVSLYDNEVKLYGGRIEFGCWYLP